MNTISLDQLAVGEGGRSNGAPRQEMSEGPVPQDRPPASSAHAAVATLCCSACAAESLCCYVGCVIDPMSREANGVFSNGRIGFCNRCWSHTEYDISFEGIGGRITDVFSTMSNALGTLCRQRPNWDVPNVSSISVVDRVLHTQIIWVPFYRVSAYTDRQGQFMPTSSTLRKGSGAYADNYYCTRCWEQFLNEQGSYDPDIEDDDPDFRAECEIKKWMKRPWWRKIWNDCTDSDEIWDLIKYTQRDQTIRRFMLEEWKAPLYSFGDVPRCL